MTTSEIEPLSLTKTGRLSRRLWALPLVILLAMAVFIANGSRRLPADANQPILIQGTFQAPSSEPQRLRVATFNIHSAKGADKKTDLARVASVLRISPDIVGLNEVRGTFHPDWWPDQAAALGRSLGMQSAFIPTESRWWHDHFGNGLLLRLPVRQICRIPLVGTRGKAFRCASLTQFEFQKQTIQLLAVHIDSQSDREHQLYSVLSLFVGLQPPAILMGDLNSSPEDPQMKNLLARPDVNDVLEGTKGHRIDWIICRGLRCHSGRLIENDASDHPAVVADLELME